MGDVPLGAVVTECAGWRRCLASFLLLVGCCKLQLPAGSLPGILGNFRAPQGKDRGLSRLNRWRLLDLERSSALYLSLIHI